MFFAFHISHFAFTPRFAFALRNASSTASGPPSPAGEGLISRFAFHISHFAFIPRFAFHISHLFTFPSAHWQTDTIQSGFASLSVCMACRHCNIVLQTP